MLQHHLLNDYTPRQAAYDIALEWLRAAYVGKTSDIEDYATAAARRRDIKVQIAKLHNKLLNESKLDGTPLDGTPLIEEF